MLRWRMEFGGRERVLRLRAEALRSGRQRKLEGFHHLSVILSKPKARRRIRTSFGRRMKFVREALEPPVTRLTETAAFPTLLLCIFSIDKCPPCVV